MAEWASTPLTTAMCLHRALPHLTLLRLGLAHVRHDARLDLVHPQLLLGDDGLTAALLGVADADNEAWQPSRGAQRPPLLLPWRLVAT